MRIDVHAHYFPADYLDRIERAAPGVVDTRQGRRSAWLTDEADIAARIETMDRAGVDRQVLSIATAGPYFGDADEAAAAARAINDRYADLCAARPDRFSAFACVPFPHVEAALAELAYALDERRLAGIGVLTTMHGRTLDDPAFDPVYDALDRRGGVLFVHPVGRSCESPLLEGTRLTWPLGAPFEDSVAALQLVQNRFATRFPNVRVILPHLGGTVPFLAERLDHMADRFVPNGVVPSVELRRFWYDTVNGTPSALRCARDVLGADRLLLGTDYPFWRGEAHALAVDYVRRAGLSGAEVDAIDGGNACTLFGELLTRARR